MRRTGEGPGEHVRNARPIEGRNDPPQQSAVFTYVGSSPGIGTTWRLSLGREPPRVLVTSDRSSRFGRWGFTTDGRAVYYTRAAWERDVGVMNLKR